MRFRLAAAALAALLFAPPAAAQTDALDAMRGVLQRLATNTGDVNDYTLKLQSGALETEVYVYREGDEWEVATPDDDQLGEMLGALVLWPHFGAMGPELLESGEVSAEELAEIGTALTLTRETLNGRPAELLVVRPGDLVEEDDGNMPDSLRMFVDPESRQILRVQVTGSTEAMGEIGAGGGDMEASMDFADYRETDGLTVPHAMRMTVEVDLELTDEQRAGMRAGMEYARTQMSQMVGEDSTDAREGAAMIDLFLALITDGRMEMPVTVESVRVNAGAPDWFEN